jgi:transposase
MSYYVGLDVSLQATFVSIIDKDGKIIKEREVISEVEELSKYLKGEGLVYEKIGIESGQLSIHLCKGLIGEGLPVICVDARHMASALSARINKNDKNDARGIAQMLRAGLYKEVQIKSDEGCHLKVVLGSRRQLVSIRQQLCGTVRGLLKIYGIKIKHRTEYKRFVIKVKESISSIDNFGFTAIDEMLGNILLLEKSIANLDSKLSSLVKEDKDCKNLMSIPGVGVITALTYKTTIDDPTRFDDSETVGAYMGLTPKQYASGEIDRHGRISKMGPKECRSMLYEAAQSLLVISKKKCKLKAWGLKLAKKKGMKKAIVAVARKLAVIMHRILIDKTEFSYQ